MICVDNFQNGPLCLTKYPKSRCDYSKLKKVTPQTNDCDQTFKLDLTDTDWMKTIFQQTSTALFFFGIPLFVVNNKCVS